MTGVRKNDKGLFIIKKEMGAYCTCGEPETPRIEEITPYKLAVFKNDRLKAKRFNYFGPILRLSKYQEKPIPG